MIDEPFRKALAKTSSRFVQIYKMFGITPNILTVMGFLGSLISAFLVSQGFFVASFFTWWLSRLADGTDGILARETNTATHFGAYLDILCDMGSYSVMAVGFSYYMPHLSLLWCWVLLGYVLCITSALAFGILEKELAIKKSDNRGLRLGAGLAEGGETGIFYSLCMMFPQSIESLIGVWLCILSWTVATRTYLGFKATYTRPL